MVISYKKLWKLLIDRNYEEERPYGTCRCQPIFNHKNGTQ